MTRDEAVAEIERIKTIRPTCSKCERRGIDLAYLLPPPGFEMEAHRAGYVKRCDACANGKLFPWADQLDPDKVIAFVDSDPRCIDAKGPKAFLIEILKETL